MANKLHPAEQYAHDVRSGKITTCEYVRFAVKRYFDDHANALEKGWHFDRKAAIRAIKFIEKS